MKEQKSTAGMSLVVKTVTHWLKGFIFLFGAYIVLYGHVTPGGGFAGGVILACAFILIFLAEGQAPAEHTVSRGVASELDSVGVLIFLVVAVAGMRIAGIFFRNFITTAEGSYFKLLSAGVIPVYNIAIGLKVCMSLFMVFTMVSALHVAVKAGKRKMVRRGRK